MKILFVPLLLFALPVFGGEPVDFEKDVKPLLEGVCLRCHGAEKQESGFRLDRREFAFKGGEIHSEKVIRKGHPEDSHLYLRTSSEPDSKEAMPPKESLNSQQQGLLKRWIAEGAKWPEGIVLERTRRVGPKEMKKLFIKGGPFSNHDKELLRLWAAQGFDWLDSEWALNEFFVGRDSIREDGIFLVREMRKDIIEKSTVTQERDMRNYQSEIPKLGVPYHMVAIKGGEFLMGSPADEKHRKKDEGPQRKVKIEPFWMGEYEITWNQFEPFMLTGVARNKDGSLADVPENAVPVDIVSSPTTPYIEMSFGMGKDGFPAINMTQHAASKFCQWLSAQTGHFYRLPTEAEWEYACRAGTTTAYHFGDDPKKLHEYGWYWTEKGDESEDKYHLVGTKKPNQWGLYDMHGNVFEWCLDQYYPNSYSGGVATIPAMKLYPRVMRGGSWYDEPQELRSASRFFSSRDFKDQDPMLPKSLWHHTDALWLGFRIVRPLKIPSAEEMEGIWNSGKIFEKNR